MTCTEMNTILDCWKDELMLCNWNINWKVSLQMEDGECFKDIFPFVMITGEHEAMIDIQADLREEDSILEFNFDIDYVIVMALLQIHFGAFSSDDFNDFSTKFDLLDDLATGLVLRKRRYNDENGNHLSSLRDDRVIA